VSEGEQNLTGRQSQLSEAKRALLEARLRGNAARRNDAIPPRPQHEPAPLSFAQERLWLVEQLEPGNTAYNISRVYRFSGSLDHAALVKALHEIISRHESLRTSITVVDGEARQLVAPEISVNLVAEDFSSSAEPLAKLTRIANEEAARAFDLSQAPLFRLRLFKLAEHEHALLLTIHHLISDFWSLGLFHSELSALYEKYATADERKPLPQRPIQYADYSTWQRSELDENNARSAIKYWTQQLSQTPKALNLPTDKQRPMRLSFKGGFETRSLSKALSRQLSALARQENATLFMIMLAAFNVLLYRYTNQEDILVGVPMTGRNRVETESLIGFFVNTVVMRSDLSGEPTFRELLKRTREMTLAAYENQQLPFERLVQELQPARGLGHSPFFQVMLDVQSTGEQPAEGWRVEEIEIDRGGARADLLLFVTDTANSLDCWLEYSSDLYHSETVARMLRHFETLLTNIAVNPDQNVSGLELLTSEEREQLLTLNQTRPAFAGKTLAEMFAAQVERSPDAIALTFESEKLTYKELDQRSNQLANHLLGHNPGTEALVALCLERSIDLVVAILGVLKAGCAYLPLDPTYPVERLNFMVTDSDARVLVTQSQHLDKFQEAGMPVICVDSDRETISTASTAQPNIKTVPENLAYVIYTSGSTGKPKGVAVTHANVARLMAATEASFHFDEKDVWSLFHSHAFDFSVWEIWGALLYGGRLVIVPYWISRAPEEFYRLICEEKVTVLNQTPSAFRQLIKVDAAAQSDDLSLRLVIFGGEALELSSLRPWWERHDEARPQLVNMYGITETTVHVTYRPLTKTDLDEARSVIGVGLDDLQVYVLDRRQQLLPLGVPGEMYVGGAGLSRGYLNRPDLTAERFVPHPFSTTPGERLYRTGDVARYLRPGELEYLGRSDRQVKVRGFRIELGEIEAVVMRHDDVQACAVLPFADATGDQQLVAYVVNKPGRALEREALRAFLRERLPFHMAPAFFIGLDEIPLTANGKIDRDALPAPEKSRDDASAAFVAPRTDAELKLAALWSEILKIESIGIHDNFFDLGGHSLLATQVMSRIRETFNVNLPLQYFFEKPTVAGLAEFLRTTRAEDQRVMPDIKRLPRG